MKLFTLVSAVILPMLAMAQEQEATTTTTLTSTTTLTKTVTLSKYTETVFSNGTISSGPTGASTTVRPPASTTTAAPTESSSSAAGALDVANVAFAGIAGMVVVALM